MPPDPTPATIGADTIVNVLPGGVFSFRHGVTATDGAVVNVDGGLISMTGSNAAALRLESGAIANINSGGVHRWIVALEEGFAIHRGGRTSKLSAREGASSSSQAVRSRQSKGVKPHRR